MQSFAIAAALSKDRGMGGFNGGLAPADLIVLLGYLVLSVGLGIYLSRRQDDSKDFFLAGRNMPWWAVGMSLFASNISSTTLIGLAGEGYTHGIAVFNYEWMAVVVLAFFVVFMLPTVLSAQVYTMPELLELRFSRGTRLYFSGLTLFLNIVVDTAGSLYAGGLLINVLFPEISLWVSIPCLALVAGLYTVTGGLKAVMYTDVFQAAILLVGSMTLTWLAFDAIGGWEALVSSVPAERLSLVRPASDANLPWPGLVLGVPLLGFYFWCTNQFMAQRVLSAKNLSHGTWGCLFAGLLKLPVLFIMVIPGTAATLLYPELPRGDAVFPTLVLDLLPTGLKGLVCAGFVAALMSQIDSTLHGASTLVTMDFVKPFRPGISDETLLATGRWVVIILMVAAAIWAPTLGRFGTLFTYLQSVLAYAVPPVLSLFLVGWFWSRTTARAAHMALTIGTLAGAALFIDVELLARHELHFLYAPPIIFTISTAVLVVVSLWQSKPEPIGAAWATAVARKAESQAPVGWRSPGTLSIALLVLTAIVVGAFW